MKAIYPFALPTVLLMGSCATFQKVGRQSESHQERIQQAIGDFSNIKRLHQRDSVFSVLVVDTVFRMVRREVDKRHFKWVPGKPYENLSAVTIGALNTKLLFTATTKAGTKGRLPSRFMEKEGKLFVWWDDQYPLTEEAIAIFWKYHLFQDDHGGTVLLPDYTIDETQKGADYYFCRGSLFYKRVISARAIGYYTPPKLNCHPAH